MRVTQSMISNNMLRNLSSSYAKMDTYMNQLNTGKKITKPSDDPLAAMKGMGYRSEVLKVEQYKRNTNEIHNWFDNSDAALDRATQAVQRVRELAIQASNGTYDHQERVSIAQEVNQLKEHIIDIANTKVNGKYIFNGVNTDSELIKEGTGELAEYVPVEIEISPGTKIEASVNVGETFDNLVKKLDEFVEKIDLDESSEADDTSWINDFISDIDDGLNHVIDARADLGARMNRLELAENRLDEQEIIATKMMSTNEDIDYAKVITDLITQESIHRAALSSGARIIQPSLLDFLR